MDDTDSIHGSFLVIAPVKAASKDTPDHKETLPKENWALLLATFPSFALYISCMGIFPVMYVDLAATLNVSMATAGLISSLRHTSQFTSCLFTSSLVKKYGCRKVGVTGSVINSISIAASSLSPNIWVMCLTYGVLSGFGSSCVQSGLMVIIQQRFNTNRNLATFVSMSANGLGNAIGPILTNFLMTEYGWRGMLLIQAAIVLHLAVFSLFFKSPSRYKVKDQSLFKETVNFKLLKIPAFTLYACAILFYYCQMGAYGRHLVSRGILHLGLDRSQAVLFSTISGISVAVSRLPLGFICNQPFLKNRCIAVLSCVMIFTGCVVGLGMWFIAENFVRTAVIVIMVGCGQGILVPLFQTALVELAGVDNYPRATAITNISKAIAFFISIPFAGWIYDETGNYNLPFLINGGLAVIGGIFMAAAACIHYRPTQKAVIHDENQNNETSDTV